MFARVLVVIGCLGLCAALAGCGGEPEKTGEGATGQPKKPATTAPAPKKPAPSEGDE